MELELNPFLHRADQPCCSDRACEDNLAAASYCFPYRRYVLRMSLTCTFVDISLDQSVCIPSTKYVQAWESIVLLDSD